MKFPFFNKLISKKNVESTEKVKENFEPGESQRNGWPAGHFYSPVPSIAEIKEQEDLIFGSVEKNVPGVDLNEIGQLELLRQFEKYYPSLPFSENRQPGLRYFFNNPNYTHGEAIILYCMMHFVRPRKIIEIGSGYSSCAIMDICERTFDRKVECLFIDPYPELFLSLLNPGDRDRISILQKRVQDVESNIFSGLTRKDILFIDSSHVSKIDSDVNHIFFRILPLLAPGVHVHFHDIGFPFEYPKEWIYEGRFWNEAYLLRAFLQFNASFKINFYNKFMGLFHQEELRDRMPLVMKNPGTSIWLERI